MVQTSPHVVRERQDLELLRSELDRGALDVRFKEHHVERERSGSERIGAPRLGLP